MVFYEGCLSPYPAHTGPIYIGRYGGKKKVHARGTTVGGQTCSRSVLAPSVVAPHLDDLAAINPHLDLVAARNTPLDLPHAVVELDLFYRHHALVEGHGAHVLAVQVP